MGHGRTEMTILYTHAPSEQVSEALERLSEKIATAANLVPGKEDRSYEQGGVSCKCRVLST